MSAEAAISRRSPGGQTQVALSVTAGALFNFYRGYLSGPLALVVPEHTREALFQLLCDLRATTPKDRRFLTRHARALVPRTAHGWLALGSALGFSLCGLASLACATILITISGVWALLGLAITAGLFLGGVVAVLAASLVGTAFVSGLVASGALMMYIFTASTLACLRFVAGLLLGPTPQPGPAAAHAEGQQQQDGEDGATLALPRIKTKSSPSAKAPGDDSTPTSANQPAAVGSPRRLNPAGAAACALSEATHPATVSVPAAPSSAQAAIVLRPSPYQSSSPSRGPSPLSKPSSAGGEFTLAVIKEAENGSVGSAGGSPSGAPNTPAAAAAAGMHAAQSDFSATAAT